MLVMVVFFIAFRWIHLSTPLLTYTTLFLSQALDVELRAQMRHEARDVGEPHALHFPVAAARLDRHRSEEHTSELQSQSNLVCRLLLEKKKMVVFFIAFRWIHLSTPLISVFL